MALEFNKKQLENLIQNNYINKTKHPFYDIFLLSYTKKASKEAVWNEITLRSRGIVVDIDMNIISRPFRKFFEISQLNETIKIPYHLDYSIYEKLDGSLLILYWFKGKPYLTTKGKFDSFQSIIGNKILKKKYKNIFDKLDKNQTYIFELISPLTRNIIDYKTEEDLFLIEIINTKNGSFIDIETCNYFRKPKKYNITIDQAINDNSLRPEEGYVVKFENGFRLKLKKELYKVKHEKQMLLKKQILSIIYHSSSIKILYKGNEEDIMITDLYLKANNLLEYINYYIENESINQYKMKFIDTYISIFKDDKNLSFYILKKLFYASQYYSLNHPYDLLVLR